MSSTVRVFVDSRRLDVPAGTTAIDAVRAVDPSAADSVIQGARVITDSRGLPIACDTLAHGGAIYRVVAARRRETEGDTAGLP